MKNSSYKIACNYSKNDLNIITILAQNTILSFLKKFYKRFREYIYKNGKSKLSKRK